MSLFDEIYILSILFNVVCLFFGYLFLDLYGLSDEFSLRWLNILIVEEYFFFELVKYILTNLKAVTLNLEVGTSPKSLNYIS
jgi:hypothetical protein